jgi:hypothetical protein
MTLREFLAHIAEQESAPEVDESTEVRRPASDEDEVLEVHAGR